MRDFQTFRARRAGAVLAACAFCLLRSSGALYAQPAAPTGGGASSERIRNVDPPRGAAAFDRAQAAWSRGDFDVAEAQYADALEQGGLPRKDVLKAYVYIGAARAVVGKREGSLAAFRVAATLDASFKVPPESGKKAVRLAETARKQRTQPPYIRAETPPDVGAGRLFRVEVALSVSDVKLAAPALTRVALTVSDGSASSPYKLEQAASSRVAFDVPGRIAADGATLAVRVMGIDAHGNEWAAHEVQVRVEAEASYPTPLAPAPAPSPVSVAEKPAPAHASFRTTESTRPADADRGSKGGFWSSPWPYIIGGVVLASAGAGAYLLLRPSDQVTVAPVQVQAIR